MIRKAARASLLAAALISMALTACGTGDGSGTSEPRTSPSPQTITGVITEFEHDDLSVRADDGRQFIFWVGESPMSLEELRAHYRQQTPLEITYEARNSRLVPISIEVAGQERSPSPSP